MLGLGIKKRRDLDVLEKASDDLRHYKEEVSGQNGNETQYILYKAKVIFDRNKIWHPDLEWGARDDHLEEWRVVLTIAIGHYPNIRTIRSEVNKYFRQKPPYEWEIHPTFMTTMLLYSTLVIPRKWICAALFKLPLFCGESRIKWVMRVYLTEIQGLASTGMYDEAEFVREIERLYPVLRRCGFEMPDLAFPESVPFYTRQNIHKECVRELIDWVNYKDSHVIDDVYDSNSKIRQVTSQYNDRNVEEQNPLNDDDVGRNA